LSSAEEYLPDKTLVEFAFVLAQGGHMLYIRTVA
jgi:hypothetical protein